MKLSDRYDSCSIKTRLMLISGSLLFILLCAGAMFVEHRIDASFSLHQEKRIENRLATLRFIIDSRPDYRDVLQKNLEWETAYGPNPEILTRILDSSGLTILESAGMQDNIPSHLFSPATLKGGYGDEEIVQAPNGRYFLLASEVHPSPPNDKQVSIQIALDVTTEVEIDTENHEVIFLLLLVSILVSLLLGYLVLRQQLRPLDVIADFSTRVTAPTLDNRIDSDNWPVELRRFAAVLNAMLDRLEVSFKRLTEYTSSLAHELRTPITTVIGEAEVALFRDRSPEEYQRVLESGREECLRVSRIIDNVLFLERAECGAIPVEQTRFDPAEEIGNLFEYYEALAEERCATLSCHGAATLVGDPHLFNRAVSNLLANSLTYSPIGVAIDLRVSQVDGEAVEVAVRDTGYGIAEEDQGRIFDHLYRGDLARSNYPFGSGLGLTIVKAIMDLHGGSVTAANQPGRGTCITLRFPCMPAAGLQDQFRKEG
ncbi:heavy metal sensor histidine kinase [Geomonas agri]|uniref:heavy metal sensor histidine kinase n=1 Tax=Geomonas agri TaxID=2873702 RepID=UPI001CD5D237|nr:heavy metal sensor histidine kinase [Geomonas agri]